MNINQLEETIRQKKTALNKLDQNLLEELAKQKLLEELLQDMQSCSRSSSRSRGTSSENSMLSSNLSGVSFDTEYVNQQIQKVKDFMKQLQQTGKYPQLPEFVDPQQILLEKKQRRNQKNQLESAITKNKLQPELTKKKKHKPEIVKPIEQSGEPSFELKQLEEQQMKAQFLNQQTIQKSNKRRQQLEQLVTLKQTLRSQNLRQERQMIRKQLIEQQRAKQGSRLALEQCRNFKKTLKFVTQQPLINSSTLKAERNIQFKGILKACGRAHRKAEALQQRIRNYSFYL